MILQSPSGRRRLVAEQEVREALPQVWLNSLPDEPWAARYDLIESEPNDAHFVVEIDNDGIAHLRFGDGEMGFQPSAGMSFGAIDRTGKDAADTETTARLGAAYRIGNGVAGNVGAEAISRLVLKNTTLSGVSIIVRNPLPAQGGTNAEPLAEAKLFAPHDFRDPKKIQRAIIAEDYEPIAEETRKFSKLRLHWFGPVVGMRQTWQLIRSGAKGQTMRCSRRSQQIWRNTAALATTFACCRRGMWRWT